MKCAWCGGDIGAELRVDARFCAPKCRKRAWRFRGWHATESTRSEPMTFAYADPPYIGHAWRYRREANYAGEVDHESLIGSLRRDYEHWALSCSVRSLRVLLPLCPESARVCAWVKPNGAAPATHGIHNLWEPVIVVGGRQKPPGRRDWLAAKPAIGMGTLVGRKPARFWAWLFELLGAEPGDTFVDLFPGTGLGSRAWHEYSGDGSLSAPSIVVEKVDTEPSRLEPGREAFLVDPRQLSMWDASPTPAADVSRATSERVSPSSARRLGRPTGTRPEDPRDAS